MLNDRLSVNKRFANLGAKHFCYAVQPSSWEGKPPRFGLEHARRTIVFRAKLDTDNRLHYLLSIPAPERNGIASRRAQCGPPKPRRRLKYAIPKGTHPMKVPMCVWSKLLFLRCSSSRWS